MSEIIIIIIIELKNFINITFFHFTALQTRIPLPDPPPQLNFSAVSGDRVVLPCPIQPGALTQNYSVRWMKDNLEILELSNSRYNINLSTFALIIDSVNVNDSSMDYQCHVFVNHNSNKQELYFHVYSEIIPVELSLSVIEPCSYASEGTLCTQFYPYTDKMDLASSPGSHNFPTLQPRNKAKMDPLTTSPIAGL